MSFLGSSKLFRGAQEFQTGHKKQDSTPYVRQNRLPRSLSEELFLEGLVLPTNPAERSYQIHPRAVR